jgi:replicative DNA helicase
VLICSLEMTSPEVYERILAAESSVPMSAFELGTLEPDQSDRCLETIQRLNRPLWYKAGHLGLHDIAAAAQTVKTSTGSLDLIVVDYLQLVPFGTTKRTREEEVAGVSRALKGLAMRMRVPVLALSQLNEDGKVRESRAIEHDAAVFLCIVPDADPGNPSAVEVQIRKNRFGQRAKVMMRFSGEEMWFYDEPSWVPAAERPRESVRGNWGRR